MIDFGIFYSLLRGFYDGMIKFCEAVLSVSGIVHCTQLEVRLELCNMAQVK